MKNPIYGFIAFLLVEALVAAGFLSRSDAEFAKMQLEEITFYIVLALTGLVGFKQYIDAHKHQVTKHVELHKNDPIVEENSITVKTTRENVPLFTEPSGDDDPGTPPSDGEQDPSSNTP